MHSTLPAPPRRRCCRCGGSPVATPATTIGVMAYEGDAALLLWNCPCGTTLSTHMQEVLHDE